MLRDSRIIVGLLARNVVKISLGVTKLLGDMAGTGWGSNGAHCPGGKLDHCKRVHVHRLKGSVGCGEQCPLGRKGFRGVLQARGLQFERKSNLVILSQLCHKHLNCVPYTTTSHTHNTVKCILLLIILTVNNS